VIGRAVALGLALLPSVAVAHAALVRAEPGARETVRVAPARVQLWFSERLEPAYSGVSVWREETRVDRGDARVGSDDPRRLSVSLPALDRGRYLVRYRVLSIDGHVVEGAYPFTVTEQAATR
jgi:hypothetical protein